MKESGSLSIVSFEKITGQGPIVTALKNALKKKRVPHALLFAGPRSSVPRLVALELTKALLCPNAVPAGSCDQCEDCRMLEGSVHPDFLIVEPPEEGSRVIKVEAIRQIAARANLRPLRAARKVFVVDFAEAMNETAQNALLKTLEEPPGDTVFVLIAYAAENLLPTIRSRMQTLHFLPEASQATDPAVDKIKNQLLDFILSGNFAPAAAPDLSKAERDPLAKALDALILNFRGALLFKVGAVELTGLDASEDVAVQRRLAQAGSAESLSEQIELLSQARENLLRSFNVRLTMSVLWDGLARDTELRINNGTFG